MISNLQINNTLVYLYKNFLDIGTVTASTSSLDEMGENVVVIQAPNMGSSDNEKYSIDRDLFNTYYKYNNDCCGCFILFSMRREWKLIAERHLEALEVLTDDRIKKGT